MIESLPDQLWVPGLSLRGLTLEKITPTPSGGGVFRSALTSTTVPTRPRNWGQVPLQG